MKRGKFTSKEMDLIFLAIQAVLIIASIASGGSGRVGMICYWSLVAFYHLLDFIYERFGGKE